MFKTQKDEPDSDTEKSKKRKRKLPDPVKKIIKVNNKVYKFSKQMNQKMLRILERVGLDRPILMHDKFDVIWFKDENKDASELERNLPYYGFPGYDREARQRKSENINGYAVRSKLKQRKKERGDDNFKQIEAYDTILNILTERRIPHEVLPRV